MGLAIARKIVVEKPKCAIEVNYLAGSGTEFVFTLPIDRSSILISDVDSKAAIVMLKIYILRYYQLPKTKRQCLYQKS